MDEAPEKDSATPRRKRTGRVVWHGVRVSGILLAAPLVFALIAAVLMIDRDITAPSWIKARVSERAALILGGGSLEFGTITVNVGRDLHPRVRIADAVLRDATGARLARVSEISGLMSPRGLLFERAALVQEVTLSGTQIALRRKADGSVALAFDLESADAGQAGSFAELLDQVDATFERPALAALERVDVDGLVINYADARAGRSWTVDGGSLSLDLRDDLTLTGRAFLLSGASVTELELDYSSPRGSREADLAVAIKDARAQDVATQSAAVSWLAALNAPLSADVSTTLDADGVLGPLQVGLTIGAGTLQPSGDAVPLAFESAETRLTYDPAADRIAFSQISLTSDWGQLTGQGQAFARDIVDGLPGALIGQFQLRDITMNPLGLYPEPLPITEASLDLRLRLDPFAVDIGQVVLMTPDTALAAKGRVRARPEGWAVALDVDLDRMAVSAVKSLWPESLTPGARRWFINNVHEGEVRGATAGLRIAPGQPTRVAAGYGFAETTLTFLGGMPRMTEARGTASFIDNRFVVALDAAKVRAPEGGVVSMAGSVLTIPDTTAKPARPRLDLDARATITATLSLLDQDPFRFISKAGRSVTMADGRAHTMGAISWPVVAAEDRRPGDVTFDLGATLTAVRSDAIIPGRSLASARAEVTVDNDGMAISGPITLDGVPIRGAWSRGFGPGSGDVSEVVAEVELSPRFLDAFGIALPPGSISGRGKGDLVMSLETGRPPAFTLVSDLRGLGVAIPPLNWSKPPGARGALTVAGALGTPPTVDRIALSGGGLDAEGRIRLNDAGGLAAATFDRVRIGNWLNAPITLRGRGRGRPVAVEVGGGLVDFRQARFGGAGGEAGPSEIALDRLQLTDGIALSNFRGSFTGQGGFSGQFRGQVNDGPLIQGTVVPQNGRSAIRLISDDAGGIARAAGLIRNAAGGALDLTLRPAQGEGTFDGVLSVKGLRVRDAPAIAALLDAISVVGLLQQLDGQGLSFDEVDARFRLTPRSVHIQEASAVGPGLGISLDGFYTLATKQLDLQGVISPLYLLNGIGSVLTRKGEGLIGFNYAVGGTADAPQVSVNPLSALTPGMFREIFRQPAPQVSQ